MHPETKEPIEVGIGRFGPYVRMGSVFGSLDRDDDVLALGLNRAVDLIAKKMASVRTLGTHPKDGFRAVRKGRFGPYVQHGKTVANLPRGVTMDDVTLDQAVALLAEKGKPLKPRGAAAKKKAARGGAKAKAAVDVGLLRRRRRLRGRRRRRRVRRRRRLPGRRKSRGEEEGRGEESQGAVTVSL